MGHYIDIHLRPDPEFPAHQLMAALYSKLHRALARAQASTIGVGFPGYQQKPATLGNTLRLLGPCVDLERLGTQDWLTGMRDLTVVTPVAAVPANAVHCKLRRVQAKSNPDRLRRRQMRRHGLTQAQAQERVPDSAMEVLDLPFVILASSSTGKTFPLFLRLGPPLSSPTTGAFNTYGLSPTATIPCF